MNYSEQKIAHHHRQIVHHRRNIPKLQVAALNPKHSPEKAEVLRELELLSRAALKAHQRALEHQRTLQSAEQAEKPPDQ